MFNGRRWIVSGVAALAVFATACGGADSREPAADGSDSSDSTATDTAAPSGDVDQDATFVWGYTTGAASLDFTETTSSFQYLYLQPIYDSLVTRTTDGQFEPGIAEDWELSDDGLTFTMTIAEGRSFHDGEPIDGEAVKANLERVLASDSSIVDEIAIIESIEVDGNEVSLTLSEPGGRLPAVLSDQAGMMMSPAAFDAPDRSTKPVGSGPFTVAENTEGGVSYARWDDYHDVSSIQIAGFEIAVQSDDNTRLAAVKSGQIDATFIRTSQVEEAEAAGLDITAAPRTFFYSMGLNTSSEALENDDVRQAITHALDREAISEGLYDGDCKPSVQPYPDVFWGHSDEGTVDEFGAHDPDLARQLLADAGFGDDLTLTIGAPAITTYSNLLEVVQAQLGEVGITVEPVVEESVQFTASVRQGAFDAWIGPLESGRPDVTTFWRTNYVPGGASNPGDYELPGIDELLAEANLTTDQDERAETVKKLVEASLEASPRVLSICVPNLIFAANPHVQDLVVPLDGNYTFRHVYETNS